MDRLDEFHGLRRSERLACKTPPAERRRPETLGPRFLSCMYEDWRPSRGKRRRESECSYLNELPDEILQHILSRLEVKEAARTCVVSRRWRNLWTSSTTYETSPSLKYTRSLLAATYSRQYDEYASSGAMVVRYRGRASTLDSVILAFDSEKDCGIHHDYTALNEWIQTRLSYVAQGRCCIPKRPISIPFAPVLDTAGSLQNAKLTALYFNSVALSFMDFADCTRLFPNLETLVVVNAPMYKAIVSSYSPPRNLRLKHLEIRYCKYLRYVRIYSAPNLETFKLAKNGEGTISILGQIKKCASVYLEGTFCVKMISEVQRAMPQLEQLEFNMDLIREMSLTPALHFPEFNTVKHLKLIFNFSSSQHNLNLMDLALFVVACPFLQKLTLVYGCRKLRRQHDGEDDHKHIHYDEESMKSYTHQHLQVVEFLGWCGHENEVQFANCMIKTATQLQDLIFYPSTPQHTDRSGSQTFDQASGQTDSVKKALASARRLIKKFKIIKSSRP